VLVADAKQDCRDSSGRSPCTDWLGDAVARDKGFLLTGTTG
jgi:hypothetical protein